MPRHVNLQEKRSETFFSCYDGPDEGRFVFLLTDTVKDGDIVPVFSDEYVQGPTHRDWIKPYRLYRVELETRRLLVVTSDDVLHTGQYETYCIICEAVIEHKHDDHASICPFKDRT